MLQLEIIDADPIELSISETPALVLDLYDGVIYTQVEPNGSGSAHQIITSPGSYSSGRLLAWVGGSLVYYDALNPAHLFALVGVSTVAANAGEPLEIAARGEIHQAGWGLIPDQIYQAGTNGFISVVPVAGAVFSQIVGRAKDSNTFIFQPQTIFKNG